MGTPRGLFQFRNADSTKDLNDRFSGLVVKGVFDPGATDGNAGGVTTPVIARVPGQLMVSIGGFMAVAHDGMAVIHDVPPDTLMPLTANADQYVVLRAVYNASAPADVGFEVLTTSAWNALVQSEKDKRIILGLVSTNGSEIPSNGDIDLTENDIVDKNARDFIRGVVPAAVDLPVDSPTEIQRVQVGDVYLAIAERQFYRWDGAAWLTVTDGAISSALAQHLNVIDIATAAVISRNGVGYPAHYASAVRFDTTGTNVATTQAPNYASVQEALVEIDAEKVKKAGDTMSGALQINPSTGVTGLEIQGAPSGSPPGAIIEGGSPNGIGVQAYGLGSGVGLYAEGGGTGVAAYGVHGRVLTGGAPAVYGQSDTGTGVRGESSAGIGVDAVGTTWGVFGVGVSQPGVEGAGVGVLSGVKGRAYGTGPGVLGQASGTNNVGVRGEGAGTGYGVLGVGGTTGAGGDGVVGVAGNVTKNGVSGFSIGSGDGVYGEADTGTSGNKGVHGSAQNATSGYGVYGEANPAAPGGIGVYGSGFFGVQGEGDGVGVYGKANTPSAGVAAVNSSLTLSSVPSAGLYALGDDQIALSGLSAVTNGSTGVVGTGTSFLTQVYAGCRIKFSSDQNNKYVVASVTDNTNLTLQSNYIGTTDAGTSTFVIEPATIADGEIVWSNGGQATYRRDTNQSITAGSETKVIWTTQMYPVIQRGGITVTLPDDDILVPAGTYLISYTVVLGDLLAAASNVHFRMYAYGANNSGTFSVGAHTAFSDPKVFSATSVVDLAFTNNVSVSVQTIGAGADVTVRYATISITRIHTA